MITTVDDAEQAARALRTSLAADGVEITHARALEHVAHAAGARDWTTLSARLSAPATEPEAPPPDGSDIVGVHRTIPILRIFDEAKAREFYVDFLGFTVDWEHRYAPDLPLYLQVSRSGLVLHLSEHHGDGTPGSVVFVEMTGIRALHAELIAKQYRYYRPGLERESFGLVMSVTDGFGNGFRFCERTDGA